MSEKNLIYNPFDRKMEKYRFARICNYKEEDKVPLRYLIKMSTDEVRKNQIVEFMYRAYRRRGLKVTYNDVRNMLTQALEFGEACLNDRYSIRIFNSERHFLNTQSVLEDALISVRRILVGRTQAYEAKKKNYV